MRRPGREQILDEDAFLKRELARVDIDRLSPGSLSCTNAMRESPLERRFRRSVDVVFSATLRVATLPVLLLTALAIKLDSRGPVFYSRNGWA